MPEVPHTVPELTYEFPVGYRKQDVTHTLYTLRLTLPGLYCHEWDDDGEFLCHRFLIPRTNAPVWRISIFHKTKNEIDLSEYLRHIGLCDYEKCNPIKGYDAGWGWMKENDQGKDFFSVVGTLTTGKYVYLICVTHFQEAERIDIYDQMRKLSILNDG